MEIRNKVEEFYKKLEDMRYLNIPFTLIIDDPLNNSFVQNIYYPEQDQRVTVEVYERTEEMNEEFGLNQMKTENYY